ncbi:hypothetical protein [Sediminispirochaeta smaragdinae]|uniref:Uncharacterized protein n=1 Tax=Sediminispirochaeta smaragdinae (strain DSM 11293 / JCM 15392 / SEBR 4228) TaxID=573413 RepID=E1R227_SEDSS|nr:hypothetical protein [Sediminispirochaeta smaragdinae]ADK81912.1 hypothetical protein Spirs_2809 [Sediminispirochaeta smaragdinae DSM 11293]
MTALELINIALTRMNESKLTSITIDTYVADLCRLFLKPVADEVTLEEDWQFARKREALRTDDEGENQTDYGYMYRLPADCLFPRQLRSKGQYEIEDGRLYTGDEAAVLIYTRSMVEIAHDDENGLDIPVLVTSFPVTFAQAVACRLGSQIGPKISDNFNLASALGQEYMVMLEKTKAFDGMLSPAEDEAVELWSDIQ